LIQSSIFAVGFKTSTERLTSFISSSPFRAQNDHKRSPIVATESGNMLRSRSYSVKPETDLRGGRFTGRVSAYPAGSLPHGILACTVCLRWTPPRDPHCYPIRCLRNQGKSRMTRGTFRIWWRRPSWKDSIKYTLRFADQSRKDDGAAVEPQVARRKRNNPPSLSAHVYSHQTTTVRERSRCVGDRGAQGNLLKIPPASSDKLLRTQFSLGQGREIGSIGI
jgi:hypothetical protein